MRIVSDFHDYYDTVQATGHGIIILGISMEHVLAVGNLPSIHRDPFDRVLVAQANEEGTWLISNDVRVRQYPVKIVCVKILW